MRRMGWLIRATLREGLLLQHLATLAEERQLRQQLFGLSIAPTEASLPDSESRPDATRFCLQCLPALLVSRQRDQRGAVCAVRTETEQERQVLDFAKREVVIET